MNGFLVVSLESGLLMCSRSYARADFALQTLGRDHFHLASSLFAFYKLAHTLSFTDESAGGTSEVQPATSPAATAGDTAPDGPPPQTSAAALQKAPQNELQWIKFGGVFLLFQELCSRSHPTRHPAGRQKAPSTLLIWMAAEKPQPQEKGGANPAGALPTSEIVLSINDKVDEYCLTRNPHGKQNFAWLEIIIHEALQAQAKKKASEQGIARDYISSFKVLVAKYWAALSNLNDEKKKKVKQWDARVTQPPGVSEQEYFPSIMATISSIPMRLVRALLRKKEQPTKL